jgi:Siphovirus ReqiPepy6 Gp37-like protein
MATTWEVDGLSWPQVTAFGNVLDSPTYLTPSAGSQDYVWVEVLDSNLINHGPLQFVNLTANLYYNAVGSWSMTVPYTDMLWDLIQAGDIIININWRGLFSFGGKCEQPGYLDSLPGSTGATSSINGPFIILSGADYLALIANKIAYPNPTVAWASQTATGADTVTNMALESAIKHYVSRNVGSAALASRQMGLLDIATDQARGNPVTYSVKFGSGVDLNLMDIIRTLVSNSGSQMGVQIVRNPVTHRLTMDCYVPRNLTGKAWFSTSLGNLTAINLYITDPTITDALYQGSAIFVQETASNKNQWNQTEQFTDDSSETVASNVTAAAVATLGGGAAGPNMDITATDTPFLTFGRDYGLGDMVSCEVRPGAVYSDIISSVLLTADPTQTPMVSAVPTIGNASNSTTTDPTIIGQLTSRIRALEKKMAALLWLHTMGAQAPLPSCRRRPTGKVSCRRLVFGTASMGRAVSRRRSIPSAGMLSWDPDSVSLKGSSGAPTQVLVRPFQRRLRRTVWTGL